MPSIDEVIETIVSHATSKYYDPVKAHEYYLKTRELKGRKKAQTLTSDKQKEGWAYVQDQIGKAEGKETETATKAAQDRLAKMQEAAMQRRDAIVKQLEETMSKLVEERTARLSKIIDDAQAEAKGIADAAQAKIDALPPIPEGIPKSRRQAYMRTRVKEIARIRNDAAAQQDGVMSKASEEANKVVGETSEKALSANEAASSASAKVASELQTSIKTAQDNYAKLRQQLAAKYDAQRQNEFDAIRTTVR
jgi:hypothetical protein